MRKGDGVRRSAAEWGEIVRSWEGSGQSATTYGRRIGVRAGTLSWWRWRLRSPPGKNERLRLVRVDVTPELEVADGTAEPRSWQVITTAGVLSVEGPLGTAELSTVLAALTASRTA